MTLELTAISVLTGVTLGLRYKILILIPAVVFAMIFAMIVGVAHADRFWSIVLTMVILGTAVQLGYLAGILLRAALGSIWASMGSRDPEISSQVRRT